jgi:hypothetical protein
MSARLVCICPKHGNTKLDAILERKAVRLECGCKLMQRAEGWFSPPRRQRSAAEKLELLEKFDRMGRSMGRWEAARAIGIPFGTLTRWASAYNDDPERLEPKKIGRPRKADATETKTTNHKGS